MSAARLIGRMLAAACVAAATLAAARPATAQPRLDVTVSGAWWDGYRLGERRAAITGPDAPTGTAVTLFDSDVAIRPGPGAEVRLGWRVFGRVYAEATGGVGVNAVEARIDGDIEDAAALTVSSTLTQITVEGGALVEVASVPLPAGNLVPFISGGGGYLRQVHEDRLFIETGRTFYVGGGVKWRGRAVQPRGLLQRMVLRADARLVSRTGAFDVDDERRNYITVSGGIGLRLF